MDIDISPAPGRTPIPLVGGWTAVLLEPVPGAGIVAVGLFLNGELEQLVDAPAGVRELVRQLQPRGGLPGFAPP
jgi:hypothetical protein